jgi:hypothetical protein
MNIIMAILIQARSTAKNWAACMLDDKSEAKEAKVHFDVRNDACLVTRRGR